MNEPMLTGKRVIVTRAADRSGNLADMLRVLGAEVIEIPLTITIDAADDGAALKDALAHLDRYAWVVVTSPEGARRFRSGLDDRQQTTPRPQFAAVGRATAAALCVTHDHDPERHDTGTACVDLVPTVQTGAGLGAEFPPGTGRVLLAVAQDASTDFEQAARSKGWTVDRITTYATEPISHVLDSARRAEIGSSDAVIFTASSAVGSWVAAFGHVMPPVVVAMGPRTAGALQTAGLSDVVIATEQSLDGVVAAAVSALTDTT